MNNEILEISHWLHEKGFECDKAAYIGTKYPLLYDMRDPPAKMIDGKFVSPFDKEVVPYFTLGQALELLPYTIESFDLEFSKRREYLAYVKHVSDSEIYYHKCQVTWIRKREIDYHLAALRLLKRTVEEGYVKTN